MSIVLKYCFFLTLVRAPDILFPMKPEPKIRRCRCGIEFVPDKKHPNQKWHSHGCSKRFRPDAPLRRVYVYRMTVLEFKRLATEQESRCALCQAPFNLTGARIFVACVDHSHICSNPIHQEDVGSRKHGCADCVRGIVCRSCNQVDIPFLEHHPDRQNEVERVYFAARPIKRYRSEIVLDT